MHGSSYIKIVDVMGLPPPPRPGAPLLFVERVPKTAKVVIPKSGLDGPKGTVPTNGCECRAKPKTKKKRGGGGGEGLC